MDKKVTSILSYLGILWLVAFFAGDKENAKFHLNQGLVMIIASVASSAIIGLLSGIFTSLMFVDGLAVIAGILTGILGLLSLAVSVFFLVLMIMGIVAACKDEEKVLPIIGKFQILK